MPIIVKRPKAKADLIEIWDYIADDSETRADAFIETIDKKFHALVDAPYLGIARDEIETNLRSFPAGRYVIFYRRITEGIEIIRTDGVKSCIITSKQALKDMIKNFDK